MVAERTFTWPVLIFVAVLIAFGEFFKEPIGICLLLVCVFEVCCHFIVWHQTYISICDNSIVIERNVITRKKNMIGIKNISNVNMERTLFEMLLGTSKVKLDTNSMTTADQTDVKILLKKADALELQKYILDLIKPKETEANLKTEQTEEYCVEETVSDILWHGIFDNSILSAVILAVFLLGVAEMPLDILGKMNFVWFMVGILSVIAVSVLFSVIKNLVLYSNFKMKRIGDKLEISYGTVRRSNYTIPIDKVNALKLKQSFRARVTGRYMGEIINVGIDDEGENEQVFLLPYCSKAQLIDDLGRLLPELQC